MDTQNNPIEEYIANAEAAFTNKQFEVSLEWFEKALEVSPDNIYALTRAGAACVPLKKFDKSLEYFKRTVELSPESGDQYFNLANAYFFNENYTEALENYAKAEIKGCSEDAKPKLFYQMAVICRIKGDLKSALINFIKFEESDKSGKTAGDPGVILEKVRLYLLAREYDNAENCAAQLLLLAPGEFNSYSVYFQILMANRKFEKAEQILQDALKYSTLDDAKKISLEYNKVLIAVARAEAEPATAKENYSKALTIINGLLKDGNVSAERISEMTLMASELYLKTEQFDEAIACVNKLIESKKDIDVPSETPIEEVQLDEYTIDEMVRNSVDEMEEKFGDEELPAEISYDEEGREVREYPEGTFDDIGADAESEAAGDEKPSGSKKAVIPDSAEFANRLNFILLSCYASKEDYDKTFEYAGLIKHSDNLYYSYFGIYSEAFAAKKLSDSGTRFSADEAKSKYDEAISFFRTKMVKNPGDKFAVIFRTRMYAESGKFEKASELTNLLNPEEKQSLQKYISQYREEYTKQN